MLVLAMFLSIGFAAVLFLLRFLFALDSEISSERKRSKARFDHITAYRTSSGDRVSGVPASPWCMAAGGWRASGLTAGFVSIRARGILS